MFYSAIKEKENYLHLYGEDTKGQESDYNRVLFKGTEGKT
jgi:hypothetical protein